MHGATRTASRPTGVDYCRSWGSYKVLLPDIARDLSRGLLDHAWWVSFGEQKRVSFAERQGSKLTKRLQTSSGGYGSIPEMQCY